MSYTHGTYAAYGTHKCRCHKCRLAKSYVRSADFEKAKRKRAA